MTSGPFDKVPMELLSQILTAVWRSHTEDDSISRFCFPSIPAQVNRFFWDTAASTPILWSYLRVGHIGHLEHTQDRIDNRSGALPLDIYLIFAGVTYENADEMIKRTILHSPSRSQSITLSYRDFAPKDKFWDHLRSLSTLSAILNPSHFSMIHRGPEPDSLQFLPIPGSALRTLRLSFCDFAWSAIVFPNTLEVLSIHEMGTSERLTAAIVIQSLGLGSARQCLRSLSLGGLNIQDLKDMPTEGCVLLEVKELELHDLLFNDLVSLLSFILTPNIHHLTLKNIYHRDTPPAFETFWESLRFPHLHHFTTSQASNVIGTQLDRFLGSLPASVEHLNITGTWGEDYATMALLKPSKAAFCSRLRHITARGISLPNLVSLVDGRCTSLHTLEVAFNFVTIQSWGIQSNEPQTLAQTHDAEHEAMTQGQLARCFNRLRSSVMELKIFRDGTNGKIDESTTLAFKELDSRDDSPKEPNI